VNHDDIHVVLDRLIEIPDNEVGDWNDVLARAPVPTRRRRPRRTAIVLLAAGIVAAVLALTVASPWRGGPTILSRAAAAIPAPTSSQILYENIVIHTSAISRRGASAIHMQVWLTGTTPHRFRVLLDGHAQPGRVDVGSTIGSTVGLSYDDVYRVLDPVPFRLPIAEASLNPAAFIRAAINSGRARPDGTSTLAGRKVIRIVVTSRLSGRAVGSTLYFVDAHTYEPVRVIVSAAVPNGSPIGFPMASLVALPYGQFPEPKRPYVLVFDFAQFHYLAPTAKNRGLANIRTQHPGVKIA
jgi:hypothetical protein